MHMEEFKFKRDPYSIIITGVGGQGNVLASRILSNMIVRKGYYVTIGETFGASQRGGSVTSHIRVSNKSAWSPQVPKGQADLIAALEPLEAIRVLLSYGNQKSKVITNSRPIYPLEVVSGEKNYPSLEEIKLAVKELSSKAWFMNATDEALKLGYSILGNIIVIGALSGIGELPIDREDFKEVISKSFAADKVDLNLKAFDIGSKIVNQ